MIDSTGLQVYGAGQWLETKHGARSRRKWRKLHLAVDAANGMIVAQTLTDQDAGDPSQVGPLLDQIDKPIGQVTVDGAPTYQTIAARSEDIEVVIPPRSTAVSSGEPSPPTQRDRHLAMIAERQVGNVSQGGSSSKYDLSTMLQITTDICCHRNGDCRVQVQRYDN